MNKKHKKKHSYTQSAVKVSQDILKAFQKQRRKLIRMSLLSMSLTFGSLAIVGTQLFYPFHVVIGGSIFLLSFFPLVYRVYLSRETWRKYNAYGLTVGFIGRERKRLVAAVTLILIVAVFLWVRPLDQNPFADMDNQQTVKAVQDDMYRSVTAMDYLESTGNELLVVLASDVENNNQTEDITNAFTVFLDAVAYSESLTEVHKYFAGISYSNWDVRLDSFLIANSLYTKKYEIIHRIMVAVDGSEFKKKALNQYIPSVDSAYTYNEMVTYFYKPKTRLRLTGGNLYQRLFIGDADHGDQFVLLRDKSYGSYEYLSSNFGRTLVHSAEYIVDSAEQKMFEAWFPIQKGVATAMGRAIISTRGKTGLISVEQAREMEVVLEPGDIMLQRRNWHISNVGIPGFWTHSALYTGSLESMDDYFASEFPYQGFESMSEYMKEKTPQAYEEYQTGGNESDRPAVIEAIEPGVVVQTLPTSANADFVVVLRPTKLNKQDNMLSLLKSFENMGKPYDFNFDFDTRDALVCSELVYDAYYERLPDKKGLQIKTSLVNGRKIVSPYDIALKYVNERGSGEQELEFVYFLEGSESEGLAHVSDEATFTESIEWSKFSFIQAK